MFSIATHKFEKAKSVAHWTNVAHFVGVNSCDRDGFDLIAFAAGNHEHFSFVIETLPAAKQLRNQLSIQHAKATLRVRDFLTAKAADPIAHITIHDAPNERHPGEIVHAIPEKKARPSGRRGGFYKPIDLFGKMLAVGIKNDHRSELAI